jgi:Na+-driven multidrug efflux pump
MLYNYQLLKYAGSNGVAAYGVIMYGGFIFTGVYFGFSMGVAPVISYHYGAADTDELKGLFKKCLRIIFSFMIILVTLSEIFTEPICAIFVGYDKTLLSMTTEAFRIYSISYIFMGFNIFGSSLFTALNNGAISALISFMRTLFFEVVSVLVLPLIFAIDGVWSAVICAEAFCLIVTITCILKFRKRYHYA